jgi:hypothetical protein
MDARRHDMRSDEGIVVGRGDATIARRWSKLPRDIVHAVREKRWQRGQQKDDQDDEEDGAHRPFQGAIYEQEKRCEVPLSEAAEHGIHGQRYSYEAKSHQATVAGCTMTKPRLWEKLNLSQWGRVKALADYLGFKVQRLKADQCRLLMPNVEVNDTLTNIEVTDTLTNIEALLREAAEENLFPSGT